MRIGVEKKWWLYVGRGFYNNARLQITFVAAFLPEADIDSIPWRIYWQWSSDRLPHFLWRDGKIVGWCAFGRSRII